MSDRRSAWSCAAGLTSVYLLLHPGHLVTVDGMLLFYAAKRLLFAGALTFSPYLETPVGPQHAPFHTIGMTLLYVPALAAWLPLRRWVPSLATIPSTAEALPVSLAYVLCSWINPVLTATTAGTLYGLGRHVGLSSRWALVAAVLYGLATPAAVYARLDVNQPLAALGLIIATWGLLADRPGRAGLGLGIAALARVEYLVLAPVAAAWLGWRRARPAALIATALPVATAAAVILGVNHRRWADVPGVHPLGYPGELFEPSWRALAGLLLSPTVGFLVFVPAAVLAIPGWRRLGAAGALCGAMSGTMLGVYACYRIWWAGASWGPRFLVPVLPLVMLGVVVALAAASPRWRFAAAVLLVWGAAATLTAPLDPWWWQLARADSPLRRGLGREGDPLWRWLTGAAPRAGAFGQTALSPGSGLPRAPSPSSASTRARPSLAARPARGPRRRRPGGRRRCREPSTWPGGLGDAVSRRDTWCPGRRPPGHPRPGPDAESRSSAPPRPRRS